MSGEGVRRRGVIAVVLAALAVVLVAVVSSGARVPMATEGSGGWHLTVGNNRPERVVETPPTLPPTAPQAGSGIPGREIAMIFQAFLITGLIVLLIACGMAAMRSWRRTRQPRPPALAPDVLAAPMPAPDAIVDALDEGLEALVAGPVDEVVIACWVKLEEAAAAAGVERLASETASELAARVLAELHAPDVAVDRLLGRYRTARYSRHPLDEDDRAVAIRSLEEIRAAIVGAPA